MTMKKDYKLGTAVCRVARGGASTPASSAECNLIDWEKLSHLFLAKGVAACSGMTVLNDYANVNCGGSSPVERLHTQKEGT